MSSGSMIFGNCRGKMGDVVFERQSDKEMQRTYYVKHRRNDSLATLESRCRLAICSKAWNYFNSIGATTFTQRQFCKVNYKKAIVVPKQIYDNDPLGCSYVDWQLSDREQTRLRFQDPYLGVQIRGVDILRFSLINRVIPISTIRGMIDLPSSRRPSVSDKKIFSLCLLNYFNLSVFKGGVLNYFAQRRHYFYDIFPFPLVKYVLGETFIFNMEELVSKLSYESEYFTFVDDTSFELYDLSFDYDENSYKMGKGVDLYPIHPIVGSVNSIRQAHIYGQYYTNYEEGYDPPEEPGSMDFTFEYDLRTLSSIDSYQGCVNLGYASFILGKYITYASQLSQQRELILNRYDSFKEEWLNTWCKPYEKSPEL